ncbi:hypothetical protein [Pseudomonas sp. PDM22]|uniref:hypothetical protein n=1 Tax=Pseudomonas sp. PDM22 TaxID=2769287 RepID=UPI00177FC2DC|nr:hypothetical protein [Pseudomonas sp. PDM22]MBD9513704.1 hypothetical protein [Pseudomonas sp. PDM22]
MSFSVLEEFRDHDAEIRGAIFNRGVNRACYRIVEIEGSRWSFLLRAVDDRSVFWRTYLIRSLADAVNLAADPVWSRHTLYVLFCSHDGIAIKQECQKVLNIYEAVFSSQGGSSFLVETVDGEFADDPIMEGEVPTSRAKVYCSEQGQ